MRALLLTVLLLACAGQGAAPGVVYTDITQSAGIGFRHSYGDRHLDNIVEGTGSGACFLDVDNDGLQDIYFVTGVWTRGVSDNQGRDLRGKASGRLYRNQGGGTFEDVTERAGVGSTVYGTGCSAADFDNDGDVDLYLLNYGPNLLYRNDGNGRFTEVSAGAGLADARWSVNAVWLDFDNDGWLDVYVANYLLYDDGKFRDFYPAQGYPGPLSYRGEADALYRNNGDGTFSEVSKAAGVSVGNGRAMSASAADFNNDGYMDLYVANDAMENYYFENTGKGSFVEKALELGIAYSEHGQGVASMGPAVADVNRDGHFDLFIPDLNYCSLLVYNPAKAVFENRTDKAGLSVVMGQYAGWASALLDYDNDGWPDIFTVHGNAHHEYVQEDTLARNRGDGTFEDVSAESGDYFHQKYVGRGGAVADIDNDGDLDLLVVNLNDAPRLLRNDGGNRRNWLLVDARLAFKGGERTAIGARVIVRASGLTQIDDVNPVRGYLSQNDARVHFGLGDAKEAEVEIRWPGGSVQQLGTVKANQILKVVHKAGKP